MWQFGHDHLAASSYSLADLIYLRSWLAVLPLSEPDEKHSQRKGSFKRGSSLQNGGYAGKFVDITMVRFQELATVLWDPVALFVFSILQLNATLIFTVYSLNFHF